MRLCAALLALACGLDACAAPPGERYADLGMNTFDVSGTLLSSECVPMPVILGSKVVKDYSLARELGAHVVAVPERADVTLSGISDPTLSHQSVSHTELDHGYAKALSLETVDGYAYTLVLTSPCNR
jgi:hypothetical protein